MVRRRVRVFCVGDASPNSWRRPASQVTRQIFGVFDREISPSPPAKSRRRREISRLDGEISRCMPARSGCGLDYLLAWPRQCSHAAAGMLAGARRRGAAHALAWPLSLRKLSSLCLLRRRRRKGSRGSRRFGSRERRPTQAACLCSPRQSRARRVVTQVGPREACRSGSRAARNGRPQHTFQREPVRDEGW